MFQSESAATIEETVSKDEEVDDSVDDTAQLPILAIRSLYERYRMLRTLDALRPTFVIFYQIDLAAMRQLEVFFYDKFFQYIPT